LEVSAAVTLEMLETDTATTVRRKDTGSYSYIYQGTFETDIGTSVRRESVGSSN
jgi:hypothetical protein